RALHALGRAGVGARALREVGQVGSDGGARGAAEELFGAGQGQRTALDQGVAVGRHGGVQALGGDGGGHQADLGGPGAVEHVAGQVELGGGARGQAGEDGGADHGG